MTSLSGPIVDLYHNLLDAWNRRDAAGYAAPFTESAQVIGFDGSVMSGRPEIEMSLRQIFADHQTGRYVSIVKHIDTPVPDVAVLRAVSGLVPAGAQDLNPVTNAIQLLVATRHEGAWQIAAFSNTPAQFHGRPELAEALTAELRQHM